jgi:hypothetical protein
MKQDPSKPFLLSRQGNKETYIQQLVVQTGRAATMDWIE